DSYDSWSRPNGSPAVALNRHCPPRLAPSLAPAMSYATIPSDDVTTTTHASSTCALVLMSGPRAAGRVQSGSGEDHNHFAGGASLTDMSKRGGNLVECERAVDGDLDVPGGAEGGKRLKVGRPLLDSKDPDGASGESPNQSADGKQAQQRGHRPTHAPIRAAVRQRTPIGKYGPVRGQVQNQVVRLGGPGEVVSAIVDHVIRADRTHEVQLGGVAERGDGRTGPLCRRK